MSRKSARGKGDLPRGKTPGMRKDYMRQIARQDASSTADTDYFAAMQGKDSTYSRPSLEVSSEDLSGPPPWYTRPLMPRWASVAMVYIAALGLLGGAIWFVASMKSDITENRERLRSLERSEASFQESVRHEIERLEKSAEKTLSEVRALFQGQSRRREATK